VANEVPKQKLIGGSSAEGSQSCNGELFSEAAKSLAIRSNVGHSRPWCRAAPITRRCGPWNYSDTRRWRRRRRGVDKSILPYLTPLSTSRRVCGSSWLCPPDASAGAIPLMARGAEKIPPKRRGPWRLLQSVTALCCSAVSRPKTARYCIWKVFLRPRDCRCRGFGSRWWLL
jgi:hypothetical protein